MERKIGEIFELGGEWYQCMEQPEKYDKTVCNICAFHSIGNCEIDECSGRYRSDKQNVIFNKLEKVGEPIIVIGRTFQKFTNSDSCVGCVFCNENNGCDKCCYMDESCLDNEIWIEIKQNKEDMEEKEQCGDNRFEVIEKAKRHLLHSTNIESSKEEMKLLDVFLLHCWQMGWLDSYDKEYSNSEKIGKNLKPFDLEAAKAGKPVYTRDGRKARIICFDRITCDDYSKIVACVTTYDGKDEYVLTYGIDGYIVNSQHPKDEDLMMLPEKKEGWVNVYDADTTFRFVEGMVYNTKDEAIQRAKEEVTNGQREKNEYVDTVKICWEE